MSIKMIAFVRLLSLHPTAAGRVYAALLMAAGTIALHQSDRKE